MSWRDRAISADQPAGGNWKSRAIPVTPPTGPAEPTFMQGMGMASELAPWNQVRKYTIDLAGDKLNEGLSYGGARVGFPKTGQALGVGVGGLVQMAPDILAAGSGLAEAETSPNPVMRGLVNTPEELSPEFGKQNQLMGVKSRIPQEGGTKPTFPDPYQYSSQLSKPKYGRVESLGPKIVNTSGKVISPNPLSTVEAEDAGPISFSRPRPQVPAEPLPNVVPIRYPSKPGDFLAYANNRLKFDTRLNPQELADWKVKLQTDMSNGSIPKFDDQGNITRIWQQASDLRNRVGNLYTRIAESKLNGQDVTPPAELNKSYAISKSQQAISRKVGKAAGIGAGVTGAGAVTYGAKKLWDYLK